MITNRNDELIAANRWRVTIAFAKSVYGAQ